MESRLGATSKNVVGPIVHYWMLSLHQYISYFDDNETEFLFCARAGVRIAKLYKLFCEGMGFDTFEPKIFWASRLAVCKGTFSRYPDGAMEVISKEYKGQPLSSMLKGVFKNNPQILTKTDLEDERLKAHTPVLNVWARSQTPASNAFVKYMKGCSNAFDVYIKKLIEKKKRVVLIDSGWQGTVQWLLQSAYPEISWKGLYFGRIMSTHRNHMHTDSVIGTLFEREEYDPRFPVSAVTMFHHLVEILLESRGPSIEEIPARQYSKIAEKQISANLASQATDVDDPYFSGVFDYIREQNEAGCSLASIFENYQKALPEFERIVLFPTREDAVDFGTYRRSADFGKELLVPVVRFPEDHRNESAQDRIERALWRAGQLALEYSDVERKARQLELLGGSASEMAPFAGRTDEPIKPHPTVAIITRTKNRPILLKRAAQSVAHQTYQDYLWVVVNDGGDEDDVLKILDNCDVNPRNILLISNERSLGMEAASNVGIRNSISDFIVIHDDDDSWAPDFLEKSVDFLQSGKGSHYGGVIAKTVYISEQILGDEVKEHGRFPYQDWVRNVHLAEMARGNFFAPIAFLFRRDVYDKVGGYNEALPVLGDWFFNLEFLLHADIGVIRSTTAFYHHRDVGKTDASYSNSVVGGVSKHEEYASIARNMFLRKHAQNQAAATALVAGYFAQENKQIVRKLEENLTGVSTPATQWTNSSGPSYEALETEYDRLWLIDQINRKFVFRLVDDLEEYRARMLPPTTRLKDMVETIIARGIPIESPPNFNESAYIDRYMDVATAIRDGSMPSGYLHYLLYGLEEGRQRFRH